MCKKGWQVSPNSVMNAYDVFAAQNQGKLIYRDKWESKYLFDNVTVIIYYYNFRFFVDFYYRLGDEFIVDASNNIVYNNHTVIETAERISRLVEKNVRRARV
jgi:S1-C subfamily serine protease